MLTSAAFALLLVSLVGRLPRTAPLPEASGSCQPSPSENVLPTIVGPMAGTRPAWFVDDGDLLFWDHAQHPVKTLWVIARTTVPVRITGRRIDGEGTARLRRGREDAPSEALVIANPGAESAIPGGASRDVMQAYAFLPSHVFYSSPGCWEFIVQIGSEEVRLVRQIKPPR